jgi:hypothetical protein
MQNGSSNEYGSTFTPPNFSSESPDSIVTKMDKISRRLRERESRESRLKYAMPPMIAFPDPDVAGDEIPRFTLRKRSRSGVDNFKSLSVEEAPPSKSSTTLTFTSSIPPLLSLRPTARKSQRREFSETLDSAKS